MRKGYIFDIRGYSINDGPGIRTTVFFKGCHLRCRWCHNPEGQSPKLELGFNEARCIGCQECIKNCPRQALSRCGTETIIDREKCDLCGICVQLCAAQALEFVGKEMSVEEVMKEVEKDRIFYEESSGGVTFSGGEPLRQADFLGAILIECKRKDIHSCLDTSGYAPPEILDRIGDLVDLFLYDLKIMDEERHKEYAGAPNTLILENLRRLAAKNKKIIIRIPLIAGINDTPENVVQTAEFLRSLGVISEISLLPYHRLGSQKYKKLNRPDPSNEFQIPSDEKVQEIQKKFKEFGFIVQIRS